jgi:hypothetical protein
MIEALLHTDCLIQDGRFEFLAVLDVDEVIIPRKSEDYTWHDLMKRFDYDKGYTSITPYNIIMPDLGLPLHADIPKYHYILQHTMVSCCYLNKETYLQLFF